MKKIIFYCIIAVGLTLLMLLAASCGMGDHSAVMDGTETVTVETVCKRETARVLLMDADGGVREIVLTGRTPFSFRDRSGASVALEELLVGDRVKVTAKADGRIVQMELQSRAMTASRDHGVVKSVSKESLLVYFGYCADIHKIDPADCVEIPLAGVPLGRIINLYQIDGGLTHEELAVGNYVEVVHGAATAESMLGDIYCIGRCDQVSERFTVTAISSTRAVIGSMQLDRSLFDNGRVLDEAGEAVPFELLRVGDVIEVDHSGVVAQSYPGQFLHIHDVRLVERSIP